MDQKRGLASWIREAYEIARISLDRGVSRKESKATTVDVAQPRAQRPRSPGQPPQPSRQQLCPMTAVAAEHLVTTVASQNDAYVLTRQARKGIDGDICRIALRLVGQFVHLREKLRHLRVLHPHGYVGHPLIHAPRSLRRIEEHVLEKSLWPQPRRCAPGQ